MRRLFDRSGRRDGRDTLVSLLTLVSLVVLAVFAVRAEPPLIWFSGRLADPATGAAWAGDFTATVSVATSPDGTGALTNVTAAAFADENGLFGFPVPFPEGDVFRETGDCHLVAAFSDGGSRRTSLPGQRVGFAPYALHAGSARLLESVDGSVSSLALTNLSQVGVLTVKNRLTVTGLLIVTNGVVRPKNDGNRLSVDRLALGGGSTRFLAPATDGESFVCAAEEDATKTLTVTHDGLAELSVAAPTNATVLLTVLRTDADGQVETLFDETLTGGGDSERLAFPVCAGDAVSVFATARREPAAFVWRMRTFGVKMEDD